MHPRGSRERAQGRDLLGSRLRLRFGLLRRLDLLGAENTRDSVLLRAENTHGVAVCARGQQERDEECTKKQELIAYARATVAKDVTRMMELVSGDGTCMVLSSKTEATLLSKHDGGSIVEVRLFKRGKTLDGFAMTEDFVQ